MRGMGVLAVGMLVGLFPSKRVGAETPATGRATPGFARVDREVEAFLTLVRASAATVTISRGGVILHSRGFGWRDRLKEVPTPPDALFRIGSISKVVTAALVKELIRAGKLDLDTPAFPLLGRPGKRGRADERLNDITVQHLLEHRGGWDRERSFDPLFRTTQARRELGLTRPPTPDDLIRWMMTHPLDFDPGTRIAYSNFGYCVLGRVVERVTARSFGDALVEHLLKPARIDDIRVGRTALFHRSEREVWYPTTEGPFVIEPFDSCAGLVASAPAVAAFLHRYWMNGERRYPGGKGAGFFFGSLPGTMALAVQRPDGVDVVALFNNRRDRFNDADQQVLRKRLTAAVDRVVKE